MFFRLLRKIGSDDPPGIILCFGDGLVAVLPEIPVHRTFFFVKFSGEIDPAVFAITEFLQAVDVGGKIGVLLELFFEDGSGGPHVGEGVVGLFEGLTGVAAVGFFQPVGVDVALNLEDIDEPGAFFRKQHAGPGEFFHEHGHIEVVRIVAGQVATGEPGGETLRYLPEIGGVLYRFIGNAMDGRGLRRDGDPRIDQDVLFFPLSSIGHDLDGADLDDAVGGGIGAGGFEVEEDEGFC